MAEDAVENLRLTVGSVARLKELCQGNRTRNNARVRVLEVFRYLKDRTFPLQDISVALAAGSVDVFDVVVTDGNFKTTCVLSPVFNQLVYSHRLRRNTVLLLTDYFNHVNDGDIDAEVIVIIRGLEILGNMNNSRKSASDSSLPFCVNASVKEKSGVPLTTSRGCYLPLWNNVDFVGSVWNSSDVEQRMQLENRIARVVSVADLDTFWRAMRRPYPALIGRVVGKSKVSYFGKPSDVKSRFPFVANLLVEDSSSALSVCLWNSMCVNFYKHIAIGDVICVTGYRVSRKYRPTSNTVYTTKPLAEIELSVNPSNPRGEIYKLTPQDLSPEYQIPDVPYRFVDSGSLARLPSELVCDVAGAVTFVSHDQREKSQKGKDLWMYKWVHLRDGCTDLPIIVKLYACSQPEVTQSIAVGRVLVCARMLLKVEVVNSRSPRNTYLTTTRDSQVYLLTRPGEIEGKPFSSSNVVREVIEFRKSDEAKQILWESCSGGNYCFPPLPTTFSAYNSLFPSGQPLQLVSMESVSAIMSDLQFMQHVRLTLQGFVVAMEFIPTESDGIDDSISERSSSWDDEEQDNVPTAEYQSFQCDSDSSSSQVRTRSQARKEQAQEELLSRVCTRSMARKRTMDEGQRPSKRACSEENDATGNRTPKKRTERPHKHHDLDSSNQSRGSDGHYPYEVLDSDWQETAGDLTNLGLATAHARTLPRFCSPGREHECVISAANGRHFVASQGYWRLLIMGLNRQTVLSAVFFPDMHAEASGSKHDMGRSASPFLRMLSCGQSPTGFEVTELLSCGAKEMKKRRTMFVVDLYSHGDGNVQIVLNRAF